MIRKLPVLTATLAAAATLGVGGMVLSSGAAPAYASVRPAVAPAARSHTTVSISKTGVVTGTKNKHDVSCVLKNASTGAGINGAVVDLDRNGQPDHSGATSDGGIITFTVTVDKGTSASFQCLFPGNRSFIRSASRVITVTTR